MSKRLKILLITASYPDREHPYTGIFVREHAKAVQLYNDVVVLHCCIEYPQKKRLWHIEEEKDISVTENITTYRVWYRSLPLPRGRARVSYPICIYSVYRAFFWLVEHGIRPDVIHAHFFRAGVPACYIGRVFGLPVVISEHSSAFPQKLLGWDGILEARFAFQRADMVLPVSKDLQQSIEGYGIKAHFAVIANTVDTSLFHPGSLPKQQNDIKRLLFVGGLVPVKGLKYLFHALAMLHRDRDDWYLDVVGDSPDRAEYEQMVKELGLEKKITFHGFRPKFEVAEFMRQADFLVLPSIWETMGCVLIESMCCGLPIISTSVGGIPETVPEFCGILTQPKNPKLFMESISSALSSDKQFNHRDIADFARRNYSYDSVGQKLNMIYKEVSKSKKRC